MNRMFLIALREYIENVRTKGFWVGILMMPLVLVLVAVVPFIVESTRVAKTYAVIDESGEVLTLAQHSINANDFRAFLTNFRKGQEDLLPPFLATIFSEVRSLEGEQTDQLIAYLFDGEALAPDLTRRLQSQLSLHRTDILRWWQDLPDEDKATLSSGISTNHFRMRTGNFRLDELNRLLEEDEMFAYFILGPDIVNEGTGARYVSKNLTDQDLQLWFGDIVSRIVREKRLLSSEVDAETANWVNESITFEGIKLDKDGEEEEVDPSDIARQWAPVVFVYFLWISILINTQMLITNTIEEKSNKLIEVLLSSVSAITLMGGKIIGIAATGLTIISAWFTMALAFFIGIPMLAGIELPIDLSTVLADPWFLLSFLMYFLLGYLLYAALLVGLGSLCNNLKEAQNLILPVQMIQMLPILLMVPIGRD
ncbi:MAG: ABC transporter permease, partial [Proteobacteria bacterium]|nr:ABC transporter permease [Pseudomonadota bacterium]